MGAGARADRPRADPPAERGARGGGHPRAALPHGVSATTPRTSPKRPVGASAEVWFFGYLQAFRGALGDLGEWPPCYCYVHTAAAPARGRSAVDSGAFARLRRAFGYT